ncbi:MAG: PQQ-dependent sugar dehydrogenase [Myxococcales bacterium]|nr:PQQ-dependent sugar dehydrogenase [Myxococcales bacterium]
MSKPGRRTPSASLAVLFATQAGLLSCMGVVGCVASDTRGSTAHGDDGPDGEAGASTDLAALRCAPDGPAVDEPGPVGRKDTSSLDGGAMAQPASVSAFACNLPDNMHARWGGFVALPPFPGLSFTNPTSMFEVDGRFYVAEQGGRIWGFENRPDVADKTLLLDLSSHTQDGSDGGLLAIAPHPEFGIAGSDHRGELYAYYLHRERPSPRDDLDLETETYARLSRFTLPEGEGAADPASERVLIEQRDRHIWHQGGGMFFHPTDGFLYLAIGDEGSIDCRFDTCQRLDKGLFGGVLRIDVDRRGGEVSHPIRRTPDDAVTDGYFIPNDNPFVDQPGVLEEFYALGLRNPHRMTYDPVDGLAFIGDVGNQQMEEIDVLVAGANYQWDMFEGTQMATHRPDLTRARPGIWTSPIAAYPRAELRVLIGGHVYRGDAMPELYGRYLYASYTAGEIWALQYEHVGGQVVVRGDGPILETPFAWRDRGISSFAKGQDGRLYFLTLGEGDAGTIQEILPDTDLGQRVPQRLSETGLFEDLETLSPLPTFVPYDVNVPLWSDGANKRRWVHIPKGGTVGLASQGPLDLPAGSVFLKHFEIARDERVPEERTRLETRVLVVMEQGVYGLSYRWNDAETDADVVLEHEERTLTIKGIDGRERSQRYAFPSPNECLRCHHPGGARVLGFNLPQLLRAEGDEMLGGLSDMLPWSPEPSRALLARADRLPALDDTGASLEARVRAYLDVNCAHCHGARDLGNTRWDARYRTPLEAAGIIEGPLQSRLKFPADYRMIVPGDRSRSALFQRVRARDPLLRMPPLSTSEPDRAFLTLLEEWIEALPTQPTPAAGG